MKPKTNKRIFILDDDRALLRSLQILLEAGGCEVTACADPRQGCAFLRKSARDPEATMPDVLILDYAMPGMSGEAVLQSLRGFLGSGCRVVLISAHTDSVVRLDLRSLGVDAFLEKPLDLERLRACIDEEESAC